MRSSAAVILVLIAFSIGVTAQITEPASLDRIIAGAAAQRLAYTAEFKNLLSEETKTFEIFDKNGVIKKKRSVQSTFIVYQLSGKSGAIAEYRNVLSVDGKSKSDSEKRAQDFFEEIVKVDSSKKELEKLEKEGSRYDEEISLNGLTLFEAPTLAENIRPYFEFKIIGEEKIGDRNIFLLSYQQIRESPYISTDPKTGSSDGKLNLIYDVAGGGRALNSRLRGKLWIDSLSMQVWKEQRVLYIQPEGVANPMILAQTDFEYQSSPFGILTPKKITYVEFNAEKKWRENRRVVSATFEYANFTKPDVEIKSADVKK